MSMHTWQWQTWEGLPYLTCSLLEPWLHGFFTQQFWPRSPLELAKVLQPDAEVYQLKQVHGNTVLTPSEIGGTSDKPEERGMADGLITERPMQAVWVASADCTPVLIADSKTGQVAAVHAGWRGTATKIVPQAIARFNAQGRLSDLRIVLGPAISGPVYQVSLQVAAQVAASIIPGDPDSMADAILDSLHHLPNSPLLKDPNPERGRLDIRRVIALQLEQLGISPDQVAIAPHCTYQDSRFFSYRRDPIKKVQWSGIVSTHV